MPRLLQSERDGHFYTRKGYPGLGVATYQIENEGAEALLREGVKIGDEIPSWLWEWLEAEGLAWTYGTGITGATRIDLPVLGEQPARLPIAISLDEDGWKLTILLPEIPPDWLTSLGREALEGSALGESLSGCRIRVAGSAEVVATDLWPGKGGRQLEVLPSDKPYEVTAKGPWPSEWDVGRWTRGADGLDPDGTFFRSVANGGVRLGSTTPLQLGDTYLLLGHRYGRALHAIDLLVGAGGQVRDLANWGKWRLLEISLPESESPLLMKWCDCVGRRMSSLPWRLYVVSPPATRYLVDGTPVLRCSSDLLVAAIPLNEAAARQPIVLVLDWDGRCSRPLSVQGRKVGEPVYITMPLQQAGHGRIRLAQANHLGASSPLRFWVESTIHSESVLQVNRPSPLGIAVMLDEHILAELQPWEDGIGPHEILLPAGRQQEVPRIHVRSEVPLNLLWRYGSQRGHRSCVPAGALDAYISSDLHASLQGGQPFWIRVDAGSFGILEVEIQPCRGDVQQDVSKEGGSRIRQAAMLPWLAAIAPAYARRSQGDRARRTPTEYGPGSLVTEWPWGARLRMAGWGAGVLQTHLRHLDLRLYRQKQSFSD